MCLRLAFVGLREIRRSMGWPILNVGIPGRSLGTNMVSESKMLLSPFPITTWEDPESKIKQTPATFELFWDTRFLKKSLWENSEIQVRACWRNFVRLGYLKRSCKNNRQIHLIRHEDRINKRSKNYFSWHITGKKTTVYVKCSQCIMIIKSQFKLNSFLNSYGDEMMLTQCLLLWKDSTVIRICYYKPFSLSLTA